MSDLLDILGDSTLVRGGAAPDGSAGSSSKAPEALGDKIVMIYFSAHWCPPCRRFTPVLSSLYKKLTSNSKDVEAVFVSLDNSESEFDEYTNTMPWLCVPYAESEKRMLLSRKYKASGIPHLVVVDKDGSVITMDGTSEVQLDEDGEKFPWKPPSFAELWPETILTKDGEGKTGTLQSSALKDKYLLLYFSAHWCPPCRRFTPVLSEACTKLKSERDDFECVFVSSDRDQEGFDEYWGKEMTFSALSFSDRAAKNGIAKRFDVTGIPKLIMLGPEPEDGGDRPLINDNVRPIIETGDFSEFPFPKKPYGDLAQGCDDINDKKCLIVFHENGDDDEQEEVVEVVKKVAEQKNNANEMSYYWAISAGGLANRIRQALKIDAISDEPAVVLIDVPDNGGFYVSEESDFSAENVVKFLDEPGQRRQMQ